MKVKYIIFMKNSKIIVHRTKKCSKREREIESDARGTEIRTSSWFFDIWLRYGDIDRQKLNKYNKFLSNSKLVRKNIKR